MVIGAVGLPTSTVAVAGSSTAGYWSEPATVRAGMIAVAAAVACCF